MLVGRNMPKFHLTHYVWWWVARKRERGDTRNRSPHLPNIRIQPCLFDFSTLRKENLIIHLYRFIRYIKTRKGEIDSQIVVLRRISSFDSIIVPSYFQLQWKIQLLLFWIQNANGKSHLLVSKLAENRAAKDLNSNSGEADLLKIEASDTELNQIG